MTVTELKKALTEIASFGTLAYHLRLMKQENLIASKKQTKEQGQPTKYFVKRMEKEVSKFKSTEEVEEHMKKQKIEVWVYILGLLKERPYNIKELEKKISDKFEKEIGDYVYDILDDITLNQPKYVVRKHLITELGKKFLEQHKK